VDLNDLTIDNIDNHQKYKGNMGNQPRKMMNHADLSIDYD